jgi:predicted O-methyltransferase YrrM
MFESFARKQQQVVVLHLDSHDRATVTAVQNVLGDRKLDFLFIDADHSAAGVRADFALFSPLVRDGGWVAFHDIMPNPAWTDWGIPALWQELKARYETVEFVSAENRRGTRGMGIGVLRLEDKS